MPTMLTTMHWQRGVRCVYACACVWVAQWIQTTESSLGPRTIKRPNNATAMTLWQMMIHWYNTGQLKLIQKYDALYSSFCLEHSARSVGGKERKKEKKERSGSGEWNSELVLVRVSHVFSEVFKSSRPARLQRSHQIHNFLDSSIDPCVRVHVCSI